jgi:hypothetical protein
MVKMHVDALKNNNIAKNLNLLCDLELNIGLQGEMHSIMAKNDRKYTLHKSIQDSLK